MNDTSRLVSLLLPSLPAGRASAGVPRLLGVLVLCLAAAAIDPHHASAHEPFASLVPNPLSAPNSEGRLRPCVTCHNNPDGGSGCGTPPCLNPFGVAFRASAFHWNAALAMLDSDGDGFTNGQELQDPFGIWSEGPYPGVATLATPPGNPAVTPGDADADGDRFCAFGRDTNMDGDCRDAGENDGTFDCNDSMVAIHSGATESCANVLDDDCDGAPTLTDTECTDVVDRDGDGRCPLGRDMNGDRNCAGPGEGSATIVDCDDTRANVYLSAGENCSDTVDNDCDGATDLADGQCQGDSDVDGDGYCPVGIDSNHDGDCVDAGEIITSTGDCDDTNPAVNPAAIENAAVLCGDGIDNECDGTADLNDAQCRPFRDEDMDGFCPTGMDGDGDGDCTGPTDSLLSGDCDDGSSFRSPALLENCTETERVDEDCDGAVNLADIGADGRSESTCLGYVDRDRDGYCFVGPDRNRDGDCLDASEFGFASDCDETSAIASIVNPTATEVCTDGVDNDCDGSIDPADPTCAMYVDRDHDGYCEVGKDLSLDGDCSDEDEQGGPVDEAPTNPTIYPDAPENCLDGLDNDQDGTVDSLDVECVNTVDADGDGYCPLGRDGNGDGDCTDADEDVVISDCNDDDAATGPMAMELCRDFRDNDCDTDVDLFDRGCFYLLDRDGDGFCGVGVDDNRDGDCTDEAEDRFGVDCDDARADVNPNRAEICDNLIDDDCDGAFDSSDDQCSCATDAECNDDDACTVDVCRGAGRGCGHTRALSCIDGGVSPDAAPDAGTAPSAGGCSVTRRSVSFGGTPFGLALVLALILTVRRVRAGVRSSAGPLAGSASMRQVHVSVVSAFLFAVVAFGATGTARAYSSYATAGTSAVPNSVTLGCLTCHNNAAGGDGPGCAGSGTPCLQSFGTAFRANGYVWNAALAALDSDGDGWTNGQELLNPSGSWVAGSADPGPTAEARLPGFTTASCGTFARACSLNECTLDYDNCDTSPVATCIEQTPYFSCSCPTGYSGTGAGASGCINIDECTAGNPCSENIVGSGNVCVDASPRYTCSCGSGYSRLNIGSFSETCSDVDECAAGNPCNETVSGNTCVNSVGRWDCTCGAAGYQLAGDGTFAETCGDINECAVGNPCNEDTAGSPNTCGNTVPGNTCTCGAGYTFVNGATFDFCNDINECLSSPCGVGTCANATGSYSCACPGGYSFNGTTCVNINECVTMPGVCGVGTCADNAGSYSCTCPGGYSFTGGTCQVSNACSANTDNCADAQGALCSPIGSMSWSCSCPAGYTGNGIAPVSGGTGCTDVNECVSSPCGVGTCVNTPGAYACTCPSGYSFNGTTCADVNECTTTPGLCGVGTCANLTGSYRCSCPGGYAAPAMGGTCGDINECSSSATCNAASGWGSCTNTIGAFTCSCATGYTGSGSGVTATCVNLNECVVSPPCGVGTCADTVGSYRCTCPVGYAAPPTAGSCEDVDECVDSALCNAARGYGACVNEVGSFSCSCSAGFVVTGSGRTQTCDNVDECAANSDNCDVNATCADSIPAFGAPRFTCTCNTGWQGPGNLCEDFNECLDVSTNACSPLASCINEPGNYACACNEGYEGDGRACRDRDECAAPNVCPVGEVCINQLGATTPLCECEPGAVRSTETGLCVSSCGNGLRVAGEECDDGNLTDGDGCDSHCEVEPGSACDEDAMGRTTCSIGHCGDGRFEPLLYEECDDGGDNSDTAADACRVACVRAHCGDDVVDRGEACDDGMMNSNTRPDACRTDCRASFCGDGVLDADEYCDNPQRGDGGVLVELPPEACLGACFPDAGPPDGGIGGDVSTATNGGCGCAVQGTSRSTGAGLGAMILGLALLLRRRR